MFFVIHVPKTVNDYDNIPICLQIVHHESFEVWYGIYVLDHCFIELCPHHLLCFDVFKLHVANFTGHDFAICHIIYMASHYCLINNMPDMVKHDFLNFTPLPTCQLTSWRWKPSNLIFALTNNIQGCCQCNHPQDDA
jgi:hypothetical protein